MPTRLNNGKAARAGNKPSSALVRFSGVMGRVSLKGISGNVGGPAWFEVVIQMPAELVDRTRAGEGHYTVEAGQCREREEPSLLERFRGSRGGVIDEESDNTRSYPGTSGEASFQGEVETGLSLLPALRQEISGGHVASCLVWQGQFIC